MMKLIYDLEPGSPRRLDPCPADGQPVDYFEMAPVGLPPYELYPAHKTIIVDDSVTMRPCGHRFTQQQLGDWTIHAERREGDE